MMKKTLALLISMCLILTCCTIAIAESVSRMHYVFGDWVGEYTGQVDSNKIPFGYGLFESSTPKDGEKWHYIGNWENGMPEGEGAIYFENGNIEQRMNGVCAGGTGSFIDQMASLLQTDASGLNEYAKNYSAV